MARVTVEDCLEKVEGRFDLAILAARRAKMIQQGSKPLVETGNKNIVTALREIAAGKVWFEPRKDEAAEAVEASFEEAPETDQNDTIDSDAEESEKKEGKTVTEETETS